MGRIVKQEQAKGTMSIPPRHPISAKENKKSSYLYEMPSGSLVIVYRSAMNKWEGPFRFISCEGEDMVVPLKRGTRIFISTCIKPFVNPLPQHYQVEVKNDEVGLTKDEEEKVDLRTEVRKVKLRKTATSPFFSMIDHGYEYFQVKTTRLGTFARNIKLEMSMLRTRRARLRAKR